MFVNICDRRRKGKKDREGDKRGIDAMRIRVQIRKFLVISFRLCYRIVCKHLFVVGLLEIERRKKKKKNKNKKVAMRFHI